MMSSPTPTATSPPPSVMQCPFDVIVITSPDDQAALAARELILSSCGDFRSLASASASASADHNKDDDAATSPSSVLQSSNGTLFISSCDPYGARMGSGGGTIAALAEADEAYSRLHANAISSEADAQTSSFPTVLICHAGGESSRCPTQIVLGKAWTSLPVRKRNVSSTDGNSSQSVPKDANDHSSSATVSNPTSLLISSLSNVFSDVPKGSVIVAASDVLLSFNGENSSSNNAHKRKINFDTMQENNGHSRVLGLAVPAPLSTAKNHGVFVLNSTQHHQVEQWQCQKTLQVLQKPTVSEMTSMTNPACAFYKEDEAKQNSADESSNECNAWIDTGVITFLPDASRTLRELVSTLKCCTRSGLRELYEEHITAEDKTATKRQKLDHTEASNHSESRTTSIEEFARLTAPKICLYGDMLHALRTASTATTKGDDPSGSSVLELLSDKLSQHELYTCAIGTGSFVHLGTTKELLEFQTFGATDVVDSRTYQNRYQHFGRSIGLTRRANSFVSGFKQGSGDGGNIVINSVLVSTKECGSLGRRSVLEHCHIECDGDINVGVDSIVSGIRGSVKGDSFRVPPGMCLQLLPLRQSWEQPDPSVNDTKKDTPSFVCICLKVDDGIKDAPVQTLFGLDLQFIFQRFGLGEADLWDESIPSSKRMLWNARINPVLSAKGDEIGLNYSFLDWIDCLRVCGGGAQTSLRPDSAMAGLKQWKEATRLSLSQIRKCVDSEAEARYRSSIPSKRFEQTRLKGVSRILMNRRHESCNFDYVFDSVSSSNLPPSSSLHYNLCWDAVRNALHALDTVALQALSACEFDVVGRTLMTMQLLISDTSTSLSFEDKRTTDDSGNAEKNATDETMKEAIDALQSQQIPGSVITSIASIRNSFLERDMVGECNTFLEKAASLMTERCVSGNANDRKPSMLTRTQPIPIGATATASAPARIDLSGGWSDTPPISFDYGGAVACLAVLVDSKRPLRSQCRIVKGGSGIKLRTESRSLSDETLISSTEAKIMTLQDLSDYSNPMANCALLKCALIQLGLVPLDFITNHGGTSIQPYLKSFCQTDLDDVGLEITSQSLLPTGSGMGSSSILGGCILSAIAKCVGIKLTGMGDTPTGQVEINDSNSLIYAVLMLEQLLTTGGGWQDNIGGLVGGLKLGSSDAHVLPLQTKVQRFDLSPPLIDELNHRLVLSFSGKPRLAKNILQSVLRRWARRSNEIMGTVDGLVKGASDAVDCLKSGDLDSLGQVMNQYWQSKIAMAGTDSNVEPKSVRSLLDLLSSNGLIVGATLCGAGGGGFLAMLTSKSKTLSDIEAVVEKQPDLDSFSWHSCTISEDGLIVNVVEA